MNTSFEIGTAFLEGFFLVLSPCVLSILPIVLSTSINSNRWRPLGIIFGLMSSFIFFSLFLGQIFRLFGIRPEILRLFAACLIFVFGLAMIFPALGERFQGLTNNLTKTGNVIAQKADKCEHFNGLISGVIVGISLGLIWTPCIGPLLGSALAQAASQVHLWQNFNIIISFCLGITIPMLLVMLLSKTLVYEVSFLKQNGKKLQQIFGSIILMSVLIMAKPSLNFAHDWLKLNILGDKSVEISAVTGLNSFKAGCQLNV